MILADKIIEQRKKCGWSQEELADKLGVTRQAVSKWESAQSVPDLERILELGRLFGVSTDYLLKDEIGAADRLPTPDDLPAARRVTLAEADEFLKIKDEAARRIALAAFMCIISPVCLLLLGATSDYGRAAISENAAAGIGLVVLFLIVAAAVAVFISCGMKSAPFEFLEKEVFETEYGVSGMVKERQRLYRDTHTRRNVLGACLCILSVVPLFISVALGENEFYMALSVAALLLIAGIGVMFFISTGVRWESMQKLLQEGDYTRANKKSPRAAISTAFWLTATAVFLAYSFITSDWEHSWIVWPVAGVLYGAVAAVCAAIGPRSV